MTSGGKVQRVKVVLGSTWYTCGKSGDEMKKKEEVDYKRLFLHLLFDAALQVAIF